MEKAAGLPPKRDSLRGEFNPRWEPRKTGLPGGHPVAVAGRCAVIGGGLAGAAVAASLARRGWQVQVLDAAGTPAAGASGLPGGVLAPHVSPDDSLLSRLSRSGVRATLQQAQALLREGEDWQASGVLEHRVDGSRGLPADWPAEEGRAWSREADAQQRVQAGLRDDACAVWHAQAGWIKPARLVEAWLAQPAIRWRGSTRVAGLKRDADHWQLLDAAGRELAEADLVVIAAGPASGQLLGLAPDRLPLQAIRGQVSWGLNPAGSSVLAPFPVNGHGSLIPAVPTHAGSIWLAGATFERDNTQPQLRAEDQEANLVRLQTLLPSAAQALAPRFLAGEPQAWAGVRCASPDRLPLVGPVDAALWPGVWLCTAMGSRGLSFAVLCAQLLAARLHGEPLSLPQKLAKALAANRFGKTDGAKEF